jgi:hypothetical protein
MLRRFDPARFHYWRIEFIEPRERDDDRFVLLHGEEGEVVGPMTMSPAESWLDRFDGSTVGAVAGGQSRHRAEAVTHGLFGVAFRVLLTKPNSRADDGTNNNCDRREVRPLRVV